MDFVKLDSSDEKLKEAYCEAVRNRVANGAYLTRMRQICLILFHSMVGMITVYSAVEQD